MCAKGGETQRLPVSDDMSSHRQKGMRDKRGLRRRLACVWCAGPHRVSGSSETKTYGKSATAKEHEE